MPRSAGVRPSAARPARPCCTIGGGTGQGSQTPPSHLAADPPHQRRCASLRDAHTAILSQTAGYAGAAPTHIQSRHPMRRWARPGGLTRDRLPRAPHRPRRPMVTQTHDHRAGEESKPVGAAPAPVACCIEGTADGASHNQYGSFCQGEMRPSSGSRSIQKAKAVNIAATITAAHTATALSIPYNHAPDAAPQASAAHNRP